MADTPTTITPEPTPVGTNPLTLPWPVDKHGITSMLKKEGTRAVGRVNGDPEKLDVLLGTIKVLIKHAKEKYEAQRVKNAADLARFSVREARDTEIADKARLSTIKRLETQIEDLKAKAPKGKK